MKLKAQLDVLIALQEDKTKDTTSEAKAKAKDLATKAKAKDMTSCPQGASRPRPWPRGLHLCSTHCSRRFQLHNRHFRQWRFYVGARGHSPPNLAHPPNF